MKRWNQFVLGSIVVLVGCQQSDLANVKSTAPKVGVSEVSLDLRPHKSSIDFDRRNAFFDSFPEPEIVRREFCFGTKADMTKREHRPAEPLKSMKSSKSYGGGDRLVQPAGEMFKRWGSACYAGNDSACDAGLKTILAYADGGYPKPSGFTGTNNGKFVINAYFIPSVIDFLSIHQFIKPIPQAQEKIINSYLLDVTKRFRRNHSDTRWRSDYGINAVETAQNHYIASASSSMYLGSWLGDEDLFRIGLKQWDVALGSMRSDGSLPHETSRGSRAIWYTGMTIAYIMRLAEAANTQGIDLYSRKVDGRSFHDAVSFLLKAIKDPSIVYPYAVFNKSSGGKIPYTQQETSQWSAGSWLIPYLSLFPNHPNSREILQITGKESDYARHFKYKLDVGGDAHGHWTNSHRCFYAKNIGKP
jgi:hypothetical protein